jgi:purine-binding chemotaxis protein CheW
MTASLWDPTSEALLRRRAEQLARQTDTEDARADVEVLVCRLGGERYAIETRSLRAVQWASGISQVPCTPEYVRGIVSVRGEIVTVLRLAAMIGLHGAPEIESEAQPMLLLGLPGVRAGVIVDEIIGVERVRLDALQPSLSGREFVRGVAADLTMLLDVEQLFSSGRFDVLDEAL